MSIEIKDRQTGEVLFSLGYCKSLRKWIVHEKKRGFLRNPPLIIGTDELRAWLDKEPPIVLTTEELNAMCDRNPRIDLRVLTNGGKQLL